MKETLKTITVESGLTLMSDLQMARIFGGDDTANNSGVTGSGGGCSSTTVCCGTIPKPKPKPITPK